jgi:hypothetical protein
MNNRPVGSCSSETWSRPIDTIVNTWKIPVIGEMTSLLLINECSKFVRLEEKCLSAQATHGQAASQLFTPSFILPAQVRETLPPSFLSVQSFSTLRLVTTTAIYRLGAQGDPCTATIYSILCVLIWCIIILIHQPDFCALVAADTPSNESGRNWARNCR